MYNNKEERKIIICKTGPISRNLDTKKINYEYQYVWMLQNIEQENLQKWQISVICTIRISNFLMLRFNKYLIQPK